MFTSLEEVKSVAEKFEAGKIVPRRVLYPVGKGEKRIRHKVKFMKNCYRLSGKNGFHVFLVDYNETGRANSIFIRVYAGKHFNSDLFLQGASHGKSGNLFYGNYDISDDECLAFINKAVFGKTEVEL